MATYQNVRCVKKKETIYGRIFYLMPWKLCNMMREISVFVRNICNCENFHRLKNKYTLNFGTLSVESPILRSVTKWFIYYRQDFALFHQIYIIFYFRISGLFSYSFKYHFLLSNTNRRSFLFIIFSIFKLDQSS